MKNYLSFGGGVNSVALYLLMQDLGMEFEAVFVDHGGDLPETYEYLHYFVKTGRPITVLIPDNGSLYDYAWDHKMVPLMQARWCTRLFKVEPVNNYVEKPCFMHIGIDFDEVRRVKINVEKGIESRWLLIEHQITRDGCNDLITQHGVKIPPKSNCWFCPFQKKKQWRELRRNHQDLFCKAQKLEQRNIEYRLSKNKKPITLMGNGMTLDKLINDKQHALPGMESEVEYPPCQCGL